MINKLIVNLYIPIDTILTCNQEWRESLCFPKVNNQDIKIINELEHSFIPCDKNDIDQRQIVIDTNLCIRKIKSLSFYQFLQNKLIMEATICAKKGIRNFLIQNSNAPYCNHPIVYWLIRVLSAQLRLKCNEEFVIGLRLNDKKDKWSIDIACRNNLNYIIINDQKNINIGNLYLYRTIMNNRTVKIYNNSKGKILNQQGFIIDTYGLQDVQILNEVKKLLYICQFMERENNSFYPHNMKTPVIVDLWDQEMVNLLINDADFIILNSCINNNGYCDCGINENKLDHYLNNQ